LRLNLFPGSKSKGIPESMAMTADGSEAARSRQGETP